MVEFAGTSLGQQVQTREEADRLVKCWKLYYDLGVVKEDDSWDWAGGSLEGLMPVLINGTIYSVDVRDWERCDVFSKIRTRELYSGKEER